MDKSANQQVSEKPRDKTSELLIPSQHPLHLITLVREQGLSRTGLGKPALLVSRVGPQVLFYTAHPKDGNIAGQPLSMPAFQVTPTPENQVPAINLPVQVGREGISMGGSTADCGCGSGTSVQADLVWPWAAVNWPPVFQ